MKRYEDTSLSAQERAEALVAEMTVAEAASHKGGVRGRRRYGLPG